MNSSIRVPRRQFLRGAGGFTLALPFLPSLATEAEAQAQSARRYFVGLGTAHGGIHPQNMFPATPLSTKYDLYAGHSVSHGMLARTVNGTRASVSPVLTGSSSILTDRLVSRMNVLRGFGFSFNISHHEGGHLGNMAFNTGQDADASAVQKFPFPTIDQVLAWSPSFYPSLTGIKERSMLAHWGNQVSPMSWSYSNPAAKTGSLVMSRAYSSPRSLFDQIFVANAPTTPAPPPMTAPPRRAPIVDRVLESYRSLRSSNRRLTAGDRQRLDDHMTRLSELQRRVASVSEGPPPPPPASCGDFKRPADGSGNQWIKVLADVFAAGFICGSSRIAGARVGEAFYTGTSYYNGDDAGWHNTVAHNGDSATQQKTLVAGAQDFFENVFLALAYKLDVDDGTGSTFLDNTLMQWTQESGVRTHDGTSMPIVTFGSAGKFLNTGIYADYRNQVAASKISFQDSSDYAGLTHNRWLATVLQAMGLPRSEFEKNGVQGYGTNWVGPRHTKAFVRGVIESASDIPRPLKV